MTAGVSPLHESPPASGAMRWRTQMDYSFAQGIMMSGQFARDPRWLSGVIAFVGGWGETNKLHLMTPGQGGIEAWVRISERRVRGVQNLLSVSPKVANRLGALDACIQFAISPDASGHDAGLPPVFRYAASSDTNIVRVGGDLDWPVDHFCVSLAFFFDVVNDELPQVSSGIVSRRLRLAGPPQDVLCNLESEGEKLLIELLWRDLQMGGSVGVKEAAQLAGITLRTASALLSRLWRMGVLTDRS